jgi:hypothetical protein
LLPLDFSALGEKNPWGLKFENYVEAAVVLEEDDLCNLFGLFGVLGVSNF